MGFVIRDATVEDIPAMVAVESAGYTFEEDPIGARQLRHLITRGHADVIVVESEGEVIAHAVVLLRRGSKTAHGWSMVVLPEYQHLGATTALFEWEEARLAERGYRAVSFEVRGENAKALRAYETFGYVAQKQLVDHFGPGRHGVKMVKELSGG